MGGYLLLNIPAGIGCLFPKFILALLRYGIVSKNFIGFSKNFHTSLVLLLGSKRVILFLASKN
jgi:riboflavin transporter FmnP